MSECYYTCDLYYICAFNTRLRLNYFGIFRNLEELLEILWTFSFMVFCFFSQKALHLKLHHKWFWSLCFQSLAASISGFFHIIQHPLPRPLPASSKWQARALTFHHRPPILFQYYRRLRHFSEFCEIFRGERGDFERIFGKTPETLRQFFTMFIAKPILQRYALAAIFASQKSYVANAYKNRGICLKAHANGRNFVGSVCTPCGMLLHKVLHR